MGARQPKPNPGQLPLDYSCSPPEKPEARAENPSRVLKFAKPSADSAGGEKALKMLLDKASRLPW